MHAVAASLLLHTSDNNRFRPLFPGVLRRGLSLGVSATNRNQVAVIVLLLISALAFASPEVPIHVGLKHSAHELPEGCKSEGGVLIGASLNASVRLIDCRGTRFITYNRLMHRDAKGSPHWEVVASAVLPQFQEGESINDTDCVGPVDGYTLAVARWRESKEKTYAYRISYAVRLDESAAKFEILDPKQVRCEYFENRD